MGDGAAHGIRVADAQPLIAQCCSTNFHRFQSLQTCKAWESLIEFNGVQRKKNGFAEWSTFGMVRVLLVAEMGHHRACKPFVCRAMCVKLAGSYQMSKHRMYNF